MDEIDETQGALEEHVVLSPGEQRALDGYQAAVRIYNEMWDDPYTTPVQIVDVTTGLGETPVGGWNGAYLAGHAVGVILTGHDIHGVTDCWYDDGIPTCAAGAVAAFARQYVIDHRDLDAVELASRLVQIIEPVPANLEPMALVRAYSIPLQHLANHRERYGALRLGDHVLVDNDVDGTIEQFLHADLHGQSHNFVALQDERIVPVTAVRKVRAAGSTERQP